MVLNRLRLLVETMMAALVLVKIHVPELDFPVLIVFLEVEVVFQFRVDLLPLLCVTMDLQYPCRQLV